MELKLQDQNSTSICYPNQRDTNHAWCNFEVIDDSTLYVEIAFLGIIILYFCFVLINFFKIKKYQKDYLYREGKQFGNSFIQIYWIFFIWIVTIIIRCSVNIFTYVFIMKRHQSESYPQDPSIYDLIVILSCVALFITSLSAFFVHLFLFIVPFHWLNVIMKNVRNAYSITFEGQNKLQRWIRYSNCILIYLKYLRFLFVLLLLIQPIIFYATDVLRCDWKSINNILITSQSIISLIFLSLCFYVLYYTIKNQWLRLQSRKTLVIKFFFLFIVFLFRAIFNRTLQITQAYSNTLNQYCIIMDPQKMDIRELIYLPIKLAVFHLIPATITLIIYRPSALLKQERWSSSIQADQQRYNRIIQEFGRPISSQITSGSN